MAGFFRWFIPIHLEEEIVLYLDSDVIVRGSLDPLFDINLEENLLGAVADHFSTLYYGDTAPVSFNSGVMLINNSLWKKEEIYNSLMRIADKGSAVGVGDQEYLNILTQNRWIDIGKQYNVKMSILMHMGDQICIIFMMIANLLLFIIIVKINRGINIVNRDTVQNGGIILV